jgi:Phage integrase, N-terminal SAM-like domain
LKSDRSYVDFQRRRSRLHRQGHVGRLGWRWRRRICARRPASSTTRCDREQQDHGKTGAVKFGCRLPRKPRPKVLTPRPKCKAQVCAEDHQQGYVSKAIPTRSGTVFKVRYRVKSADGKWNQKAETLYGLSGKKAARAVLEERIRGASFAKPEGSDLSLRAFVDAWWKPYLQRKGVKPSARRNYDSILELHILPVFGELRIDEAVPLHVERFIQTKVESGLSGKTVRNLLWSYRGSSRLHWTMT